jgi:hypothetical protein
VEGEENIFQKLPLAFCGEIVMRLYIFIDSAGA